MGGEGKVEAEIGHVSIAPCSVFNATPNLCCFFLMQFFLFVIFLLVLCSGEASHPALLPEAQHISVWVQLLAAQLLRGVSARRLSMRGCEKKENNNFTTSQIEK